MLCVFHNPDNGSQSLVNLYLWASQTDTGVTPNTLAVDLPYLVTDQRYAGHAFMVSASQAATSFTDPNLVFDVPSGIYVEVVQRDNVNTVSVNPNAAANSDFFLWATAQWILANGNTTLEEDVTETFADPRYTVFGSSDHSWPCCGAAGNGSVWGLNGIFGSASLPAGFQTSDYHKYAMLLTTNGVDTVHMCGYVDDVFYGCHDVAKPLAAIGQNPDNSGSAIQRNAFAIWSANLAWGSTQPQNDSCPNSGSGQYANWCVSTKYRCHLLCHLQMSLLGGWGRAAGGRGAPGIAQHPTGDRLTGA